MGRARREPLCEGGPAEAGELAQAGGLQGEGATPHALGSRQLGARLASLGGTLDPQLQLGLRPRSGSQRSDMVAAAGGPPPRHHVRYNLAAGLGRSGAG